MWNQSGFRVESCGSMRNHVEWCDQTRRNMNQRQSTPKSRFDSGCGANQHSQKFAHRGSGHTLGRDTELNPLKRVQGLPPRLLPPNPRRGLGQGAHVRLVILHISGEGWVYRERWGRLFGQNSHGDREPCGSSVIHGGGCRKSVQTVGKRRGG